MKRDNAGKIMKMMWELEESSRNKHYFLLGMVFLMTILDAVFLYFKYSNGFELNTMDYVGGVTFVMLLGFSLISAIIHRNKAEEVHNLYLEMIMYAKK